MVRTLSHDVAHWQDYGWLWWASHGDGYQTAQHPQQLLLSALWCRLGAGLIISTSKILVNMNTHVLLSTARLVWLKTPQDVLKVRTKKNKNRYTVLCHMAPLQTVCVQCWFTGNHAHAHVHGWRSSNDVSVSVSTFSADDPAVPLTTISTSKIVQRECFIYLLIFIKGCRVHIQRHERTEAVRVSSQRLYRKMQLGLLKAPCSRTVTVPRAMAAPPVCNDCPEGRAYVGDASLTCPLSLGVLHCSQVFSVHRSTLRKVTFRSCCTRSQKQRRGWCQ